MMNEIELVPVDTIVRKGGRKNKSDWDVLVARLADAPAGQWYQVVSVDLTRYKQLGYAGVACRSAAKRAGVSVSLAFRDGQVFVTRPAEVAA